MKWMLILWLGLAAVAWAESGPAAMVVQLEGRLQAGGKALSPGALLAPGTRLEAAPQAEIVLIYFGDSHTENLTGPLTFQADRAGSKKLGGSGGLDRSAAPRAGTRDPIVDNVARMAGRVDRSRPAWKPRWCEQVQQIQVRLDPLVGRLESLEWTGADSLRLEVCPIDDHQVGDPIWSKSYFPGPSPAPGPHRVAYDGTALLAGAYLARFLPRAEKELDCAELRFNLLTPDQLQAWKEQEKELDAWAAANPKDPLPWRVRAGAAVNHGQIEAALKALSRAAKIADSAAVEGELAALCHELGRHREAAQHQRKADGK